MISKYLYIIIAVVGIAVGSGGTLFVAKMIKPVVKLECNCPSLKCPPIPPSNGIDFDKIKNVKGLTIQNHQYFVINDDTVTLEAIKKAMREVSLEQKLSRCK